MTIAAGFAVFGLVGYSMMTPPSETRMDQLGSRALFLSLFASLPEIVAQCAAMMGFGSGIRGILEDSTDSAK
jgi:hypothetical protein